MTYQPDRPPSIPPDDEHDGAPLEPWMLELAREVVDELDASVDVPRDMMWARIARARTMAGLPDMVSHDMVSHDMVSHDASSKDARSGADTADVHVLPLPVVTSLATPVSTSLSPWSRWPRKVAGLAAMLVAGVAIGRFGLPSDGTGTPSGADTSVVAAADAAGARRDDPAHLAMHEHLVRTVSLLATVGDSGAPSAEANLAPLAKELLSTTRVLLDQPQLRDERTRRLLEDLELVLVQVIQARGSAPETQRAPQETLQETDLLTRVRAIVTATAGADPAIWGGD